MAEQQRALKKHKLTIDNRESIVATGISRVDFFSDELITAQTDVGQLNIKGQNLHIESLNSDNGDMLISGKTFALSYTETSSPGSFIKRMFK